MNGYYEFIGTPIELGNKLRTSTMKDQYSNGKELIDFIIAGLPAMSEVRFELTVHLHSINVPNSGRQVVSIVYEMSPATPQSLSKQPT